MPEEGNEKGPISFRIRNFFDGVQDGFTFSKYYHKKQIPPELAHSLYGKLARNGRLNNKEGGLLGEYERTQLYKDYPTNGRILNVASGFDGLPASIYGPEKITMVSRDTDKYFSPYNQYATGIKKSPKVEADMRELPFSENYFSQVILNGFDGLDESLLAEVKRTLEPGGYFIVTARQIEGLNRNFINQLKQEGWNIRKVKSSGVLSSLVLQKQEIEDKLGLPRAIGKEGCSAELDWDEEGDNLKVLAYFSARKRGDEMMSLYTDELQKIADITKRVVISREVPLSRAGWRLMERTPGYTKLKDDPKNKTDFGIYERTFIPQKQGKIKKP